MRGIRIGRVLGIELRMDWSWVFIFALLTWNLVAVFAHWHPHWPSGETAVVAASASILFFVCILLHELAHSLVATAYGLKVRSITLFLFGGVSNIERDPPSAKTEFFMAVVGPLTSILLGVAFVVLTSAATSVSVIDAAGSTDILSQLGPLATLLAWLGPVNIAIGVFNLIPGFPLDGGRILRAFLWKVTGSLRRATLSASITGQVIGWLLIAAGIAMSFGAALPFFGTGLASGLWLAFIGWFLHGAAMQATTRLALDDALAGITVEQLMQQGGPAVPGDAVVGQLVRDHLLGGEGRAVPVLHSGALVGLVSISDVRRVPPDQWAHTPVDAIMRPVSALALATPDEPLATAFEELASKDIGQLPVVDHGTLVGMLRRRDIARWVELAWKPSVSNHRVQPGAR